MNLNRQSNSSDYTAVLLAAGSGARIAELTDMPKCLLSLHGETFLSRHLRIWKNLGIKKVNLVVGYQSETVIASVADFEEDFDFNFILNNDYCSHGNTYSLYLGLREVDGPSLIFDADLVYEEAILKNFMCDESSSQILVGSGSLDDIECAKVLVDRQGLVRKTIDKRAITQQELKDFKFVGEAVGILKFSTEQTRKLKKSAAEFLSDKSNLNLNWEHLLNLYLQSNEVPIHKFESHRWLEVDTPEDFRAVQKLFSKREPSAGYED